MITNYYAVLRKYSVIVIAVFLLLFLKISSSAQICNTTSVQPSTPSINFNDNQNGTISDNQTGLMWKICPQGLSGDQCQYGSSSLLDWPSALESAMNSTFAGFNDWRVPNIKELASIVETACGDPAINTNIFPNTPSSIFWTSTPRIYSDTVTNYSIYVDFSNGYDGYYSHIEYGRNKYHNVRLVRN